MQKRIRIKDIATKAGVSPGTVDRIIHNRGNVSAKSRQAVEDVLKEMNYRPNVHMSSISLKKNYNILFIAPEFTDGEYWSSIFKGVERALDEFENISIKLKKITFDQYDVYSCREALNKASTLAIDAAIIGPVFQKETYVFCKKLEQQNIPYVFVDSYIENLAPLAYFSANHYICGYLTCKLINAIVKDNSDIGIMEAMHIGNESANSTILRKVGFDNYMSENKLNRKTLKIEFTASNPDKNEELFDEFFKQNTNVGGIVVLNSRGNVIANYLSKKKIKNIKLVGVDLTDLNIQALKNGNIDFLISQNPERQGFLAMKSLIEHLIFRMPIKVENILPLDIITKETVDLYSEFYDLVYLNRYE